MLNQVLLRTRSHYKNFNLFDLNGRVAFGVCFQTRTGGHLHLGAYCNVKSGDGIAVLVIKFAAIRQECDKKLVRVGGISTVLLVEVIHLGGSRTDVGHFSDNVLIRLPTSESNHTHDNQYHDTHDPKCLEVKLDFASSVDGKLYSESAAPWGLAPKITNPDQNANKSYKRAVTSYGPISSWKLEKDSLDENKDTEAGNANVEGGNKEKNNSEIINDEKSEDELINIKVNKLKNRIIVKGKKAKYKITKIVYKNGKAVRGTAKLMNPLSKKNKIFIIADYIKVNGIKFKVTSINKKAFYKNKKLKKVYIGKYIVSIGAKAFAGCKNLKNIKFKTKRLKKVGKSAFKGINKKAVVWIKKKKYKRLLRRKGMKKTVIFK